MDKKLYLDNERAEIEKFYTSVNILQQDKNFTMSDLQALFVSEKLYDSAKLKEAVVETGYEDNAADYANAAVDFARLGIRCRYTICITGG